MANLDDIFALPPDKPEVSVSPSDEVRRLLEDDRVVEALAVVEESLDQLDADALTRVAAILAREGTRHYQPAVANALYANAAEQGHAPAMRAAAVAYLHGAEGVEPDPPRAYDLLKRGMAAGDAESAWLVAELVDDGQISGDEVDYCSALLAAARQNHPEALATLANCCFDGRPELGIPRDRVTAHRCLTRMISSIDEDIHNTGREGLAKIEPEMSRDEIGRALASTALEPEVEDLLGDGLSSAPAPPEPQPVAKEKHNLHGKLVVFGGGGDLRGHAEMIVGALEAGAVVSTALSPAADLLVISDAARDYAESGVPSDELREAAKLRQEGKLRIVSHSDFRAVLDGKAKMKW